MMKYCPISFADGSRCCDDRCVLYENGCLIKQALRTYIDIHTPIKMKTPNIDEEDIKYLKEYLASSQKTAGPIYAMPIKAPEVTPIYEEGGDWVGLGCDDIAP